MTTLMIQIIIMIIMAMVMMIMLWNIFADVDRTPGDHIRSKGKNTNIAAKKEYQ